MTEHDEEQPRFKPTLVQKRIAEAATGELDITDNDLSYMHSVMAQVAMPYRRTASRRCQRKNGRASLLIEAGNVAGPSGERIDVPLPFGTKPRLILAHLNGEALRTGRSVISVDGTLRRFAAKILNHIPNGRETRSLKEHLRNLSAATIILSQYDERGFVDEVRSQVVSGMRLWAGEEGQQTLWPSEVRLSLDYFESLQRHAVPLDSRHLKGLSHSALALDLYAWLAQRLHRIKRGQVFMTWESLRGQFGIDYSDMRDFRKAFRGALRKVLTVYGDARVEEAMDSGGRVVGFLLEHSPPPVAPKPFFLLTE